MIKFYKIENGIALVGSGYQVPEGFIEYTVEPKELKNALANEKEAAEMELLACEAGARLAAIDA